MRTSHRLHDPAYPANPGVLAGTGRRHRPRHRATRSRTAAGVVLLALGLALVLSGPAGPTVPAFAATDQPTVTFLGDGPAPLACSSTPSPANLTVKQTTRVVLANFTGADATATIGDDSTVAVADGEAISVRLKVGSYTITMTPDCLHTYNVVPVMITVVKAETPSPSPAPSPPVRTDPAGPPATASGPGVGDTSPSTPASDGSNQTSPEQAPVAGGPASGAGVPDLADPDPSDPDIEKARAVRPDSHPDGRGDRLLAVIAAICVFGVTTAIIRAIVAQRATGALGT